MYLVIHFQYPILELLGRYEDSCGRVTNGRYPHVDYHGLGIYELLEMIGAKARVNDLDDHHRLLAGGLLLGINLVRERSAKGLDLTRTFRERDL